MVGPSSKSTHLLDVVVAEGAAILELLAGEDETLLVRGDALLVLDLALHIVDGVRGLDLKGDGLARQGLNEAVAKSALVAMLRVYRSCIACVRGMGYGIVGFAVAVFDVGDFARARERTSALWKLSVFHSGERNSAVHVWLPLTLC